MYANYKPTDTLSASSLMSGLPHDCGLVSNSSFLERLSKSMFLDYPKVTSDKD